MYMAEEECMDLIVCRDGKRRVIRVPESIGHVALVLRDSDMAHKAVTLIEEEGEVRHTMNVPFKSGIALRKRGD